MPRPPSALRALRRDRTFALRRLVVLVICFLVLQVAALIQSYPTEFANVICDTARPARLSDKETIKPSCRVNSALHLSDGHELSIAFAGPGELIAAWQQNQANLLGWQRRISMEMAWIWWAAVRSMGRIHDAYAG